MKNFSWTGVVVALAVVFPLACGNWTGKSVNVHFVARAEQKPPPPARTLRSDPSTASAMDCLLLNVRGDGVMPSFTGRTFSNGATNSCLQLGVVSKGVTLGTATTTGISVKVPPGVARTIEVLGYVGDLGASCVGKSMEELIDGGNAKIYPLASSTESLSTDKQVSLTSSYVMGTTLNRMAACRTPAPAAKIFVYDEVGDVWTDLVATDLIKIHTMAFAAGNLYVGGQFDTGMGVTNANNIVRYDVTNGTWYPLHQGLNAPVRAIYYTGTNLYVGGEFTDASGNTLTDRFARWGGSAFQWLVSGLDDGAVYGISKDSGSNILVGGDFTSANSNSQMGKIFKFHEGTSTPAHFQGATALPANTVIHTLVENSGYVYVGGEFANAGSNTDQTNLVKFNGSGMFPVGNGISGPVKTLFKTTVPSLVLAGNFLAAQAVTGADNVAIYDLVANWFPLDGGLNGPATGGVAQIGSNYYIGGAFTQAGNVTGTNHIARFDGTYWTRIVYGVDGPVTAIAADTTNRLLYVAGDFANAPLSP